MNETLRFIFLKDCTMSKRIFEVLESKTSLTFFGFSCDKDNKFEIIQSVLQLKQNNPNLIINLLKATKEDGDNDGSNSD